MKQAREAGGGCSSFHPMSTYINFAYHIVFSAKERLPLITDDIRARLHEYIGGFLRRQGHQSLGINGTVNHIHLLARIRQDVAFSDVVRDMKAGSSGWIHQTFPHAGDFAWQRGYGAFTVSQSQIERVQRYIANQAAHHQSRTFEHEFLALLKAHKVEFKEEYWWKG